MITSFGALIVLDILQMEEPLQRHHCVVYIGFTLWVWLFHTWLLIGLPFPLLVFTTSLSCVLYLFDILVDVIFFMTKVWSIPVTNLNEPKYGCFSRNYRLASYKWSTFSWWLFCLYFEGLRFAVCNAIKDIIFPLLTIIVTKYPSSNFTSMML